jgi:chorismate mutase/prephenate dehydratase
MSLDDIRIKIDALDDALFKTLCERLQLIEQVAAAKRSAGTADTIMRPGREAMILRRLLEGHEETPPSAVIARIWREIINTASLMQGDLSVAVCAPSTSVGFWDLARNHFGSTMPMSLHRSPSTVLRRVVEDKTVIGILPWPEDNEENPWWIGMALAPASDTPPKIIWRLPFYASASGHFENLKAFALSHADPEETGDDLTVIVVETNFDTSRASVTSQFEYLGVSSQIIATREDAIGGSRFLLLEIGAFIAGDDPRLQAAAERMGNNLMRMEVIGNYPAAIRMTEKTR